MQTSLFSIFFIVWYITSTIIIVVVAIIVYDKYNTAVSFVSLYISSDAIVIAASGNINAHHDIKNFIPKKLLYINAISRVKKIAILNKNIAKKSKVPNSFIYATKPIAGGAISINSVGTNLTANCWWKIILLKIIANKITQKKIPIEKKNVRNPVDANPIPPTGIRTFPTIGINHAGFECANSWLWLIQNDIVLSVKNRCKSIPGYQKKALTIGFRSLYMIDNNSIDIDTAAKKLILIGCENSFFTS